MKKNSYAQTLVFGFVLFAVISLQAVSVFAAKAYYNYEQSEQLTKGLTYHKSQMVTDAGLLDVHTLIIDLYGQNVRIEPVNSSEFGLKDTVSNLLEAEGAIAGTNGDFFGVSGTHSVPLGTEIKAGEIFSLTDLNNKDSNDSATLFIDKFNQPSSGFLKADVSFFNQGKESINIAAINRITDLSSPAIITYSAMKSTVDLDKRIANSLKIVVKNGYISHVSTYGESVDIPENGYVVIMNEALGKQKKSLFKIGESAELKTSYSIDITNTQFAVSGSHVILKNGAAVEDKSALSTNRHPRTAIGFSKDKTQLILMVVDGRTHSIGATFDELANLMIKYGAFEAVNLDGGGSSTMAVLPVGEEELSVVNTVSDSKERKVINAVGIFDDSLPGDVVKLVVKASRELVAVGSASQIEVFGLDEYNHKISIPQSELKLSISKGKAELTSNIVKATDKGSFEISASYKGLAASLELKCSDILELVPNHKEINTAVGKETVLSFIGIDEDGETVELDADVISFEVVPSDLGKLESGVFIPSQTKSGYIKCSYGKTVYYIPVSATLLPIREFALGNTSFATSAYPVAGVLAGASTFPDESGQAIELRYIFSESDVTQAAYVDFEPKLELPKETTDISLLVFGDNTGNWLRGRVTDANGKQYTIDFERHISFAGYKTLFAELPKDAAAPLSLDRVYVAALNQSFALSSTLRFSKLQALAPITLEAAATPDNSKYRDAWLFGYNEGVKGQDITILPSMKISEDKRTQEYASLRANAIKAASANSEGIVYLDSEADMEDTASFRYSKASEYNAFGFRDSQEITLNSSKGGIIQSDVSAWPKLESSIIYTGTNNIIINTDISPLSFSSKKEFELLHTMLKQYALLGKNIFVISTDGDETESVVLDGIRYIKMPKMFNADGTLNKNFSVLRLRLTNGSVRYRFDRMYE